jgi:hypothetical protein
MRAFLEESGHFTAIDLAGEICGIAVMDSIMPSRLDDSVGTGRLSVDRATVAETKLHLVSPQSTNVTNVLPLRPGHLTLRL